MMRVFRETMNTVAFEEGLILGPDPDGSNALEPGSKIMFNYIHFQKLMHEMQTTSKNLTFNK